MECYDVFIYKNDSKRCDMVLRFVLFMLIYISIRGNVYVVLFWNLDFWRFNFWGFFFIFFCILGEVNVYKLDIYKCMFFIMIDDWRKKFSVVFGIMFNFLFGFV